MRIRSLTGPSLAWLLVAMSAAAPLRAAAPASQPGEPAIVAAARCDDLASVKQLVGSSTQPTHATDAEGMTALHMAASNGNTEMVQVLLDRGANVNAQSKDIMPFYGGIDRLYNGLQTPLLLAVAHGHAGLARLLLEKGADVDVQNQFGATPVDLAVAQGYPELLKLLLARQPRLEPATLPAEKGLIWQRSPRRWTALHLAAEQGSVEAIRLLLAQKQSVAARDAYQQTPLHSVLSSIKWGSHLGEHEWMLSGIPLGDRGASRQKLAQGERWAAMRLLIEAGADVNATDGAGHTPLYYARASGGDVDLQKVLTESGAQLSLWDACKLTDVSRVRQVVEQSPAAVDQPDPLQRHPLLIALEERSLPVAKVLLDHGAKAGFLGVLNRAIERDDLLALDLLLQYRDRVDNTVYFAVIGRAFEASRGAAASKLLEHKGDVDLNTPDAAGNTVLHRVVSRNDPGAVRLLLSHGADVSIKNKDGKTGFDLLAESHLSPRDREAMEAVLKAPPAGKK